MPVRVVSLLLLALWALPAAADEVPIEKDVVYTRRGDVDLKLDLARPVKGEGPFPLVVCIHGGAWQAGNRAAHHRTIRLLAEHGYVAATVQYRLSPKHRFPAHVEDVKAAVRFLRASAKKYNLDPNRVGALGDSAGGHLSLMLGVLDPGDGLEGDGPHKDQPSKVQAVVNYYGPTDLSAWEPTDQGDMLLRRGLGRGGDGLLEDFLGTSDRKAAVMKKASPVTYLDGKDAPVLTFQGTVDPLVQPRQAELLHAALRKAGVVEQLEVLKDAGHGWGGKDRDRTDRVAIEFLDRHLKKR